MILLQGKKIRKKHDVAVYIWGWLPVTYITLSLKIALYHLVEFCDGILRVEDMKELCSAVESSDTITIWDTPSFYMCDLEGVEEA